MFSLDSLSSQGLEKSLIMQASITCKPVSSSLHVQIFVSFPLPIKPLSKVFEKGLALRLAVMEAVQITVESGLVEDQRC